MGTWGTGIDQNDVFGEVQVEFRSRARNSNDYYAIANEFFEELRNMEELDNPNILNHVIYDILYALADALWHINASAWSAILV